MIKYSIDEYEYMIWHTLSHESPLVSELGGLTLKPGRRARRREVDGNN